MLLFLQCLFLVSLVSCTIVTLLVILWIIIDDHFPNFYANNQLYYLRNMTTILSQFCAISAMYLLFFNQYSNFSVQRILLTSFVVNIVLNGSLFFYLSFNFHNKNETNIYFQFICFKSLFENCEFYLSAYVLYIGCWSQSLFMISFIVFMLVQFDHADVEMMKCIFI